MGDEQSLKMGGRGAINCKAVRQTGACEREMCARTRGPGWEMLAGLGLGT